MKVLANGMGDAFEDHEDNFRSQALIFLECVQNINLNNPTKIVAVLRQRYPLRLLYGFLHALLKDDASGFKCSLWVFERSR